MINFPSTSKFYFHIHSYFFKKNKPTQLVKRSILYWRGCGCVVVVSILNFVHYNSSFKWIHSYWYNHLVFPYYIPILNKYTLILRDRTWWRMADSQYFEIFLISFYWSICTKPEMSCICIRSIDVPLFECLWLYHTFLCDLNLSWSSFTFCWGVLVHVVIDKELTAVTWTIKL